ncbi:probable GTP-binding protein OBGC2 isoform X2 [Cryptomeria japonica]|uniref:probable GTP-binding protein OBGC2 isoform X2 n=1 Tax=Cryptomeria japonica TaxID=3369 RepID=UPI0027DA3979|nr:probable GTP-binding protein OBGC2 isoform X2 [Cryptomeria japonica]
MALDYLFSTSTRPALPIFTTLQFHQAKANTNTKVVTLKGQSVVGCIKGHKIRCTLIKSKDLSVSAPHNLEREPHKYFDHVVITVRSGDGGHGGVLSMPMPAMQRKTQGKKTKEKVKRKGSYKRDPDGNLILPMGGHGGDVVLYADESKDSLLELHQISRYNAKRGGNVDAMGTLTPMLHDGFAAPTLRIPVPVGTVVKRKRGGKLLADLTHPGDEILVARGGRGGISLVEMRQNNRRLSGAVNANVIRDENDKDMAFGQPGEEVRLELILRIVADVGLVGLPNAGKSSLLAAVTRARPDIADYPFTTLMPNLGQIDRDPDLGTWDSATLADMPGLIRGAHLGKGLGRTFLRHLRRTHLLVHVVDASVADPVQDYKTVREELLMYNPSYLERPHMVVLNKLDLPEAREKFDSISEHMAKIGCPESATGGKHMLVEENKSIEEETYRLSDGDTADNFIKQEKEIEDYPRPLAIVGISALKGIGIVEMLREIRLALKSCEVGEREGTQNESTIQPVIQKFY